MEILAFFCILGGPGYVPWGEQDGFSESGEKQFRKPKAIYKRDASAERKDFSIVNYLHLPWKVEEKEY